MFIKWKPTVVYWISACALLYNRFFSQSNCLQKLMGKNIQLPSHAWSYLSLSWAAFLSLMGVANLYIAYSYDTNTWVNFKFFGGLGLTAVFVVIQAIYLSRCAQFTFGDTPR
jgi:intracellular septation protein